MINLDNDLSIYNATRKAEHPQGVLLEWQHSGQSMQVVYPELRAPQVADWAQRVRTFVAQVENDAALRARRDREMAAPPSPPAQQADNRALTAAPVPKTESAEIRAESPRDPLAALQAQLEEARAALQQLQIAGAELARKIQAAEQNVAMLEAAVQAMQAVQEERNQAHDMPGPSRGQKKARTRRAKATE